MAELIRAFAVPPLGCNCSILGDPVMNGCRGSGGAAERILREVEDLGR